MSPELQRQIIDRLVETGAERHDWSFVVLAAMEGDTALADYLEGRAARTSLPPKDTTATTAPSESPGVYLSSITVEGFRGVGPATTLPLTPGPGLTLVVGRNGSGKSSFAEGLETLLTGRNSRWDGRKKAWVEAWQNLHHGVAALKAEVMVDGQGALTVSRTWSSKDVASSSATVRATGQPPRPLDDVGWAAALSTFRPFLSYNELGSLLEDGPSKLYDALSGVLGLDHLTAVQARLADARKVRADRLKDAEAAADDLVAALEGIAEKTPDARPAAALKAFAAKTWDFATLAALAAGTADAGAAEIDLLRRLQALAAPNPETVADLVRRLREAERACAAFAGTDAERSRQRADLLEQALRYHEAHASSTCPVCGTDGVLLADWSSSATSEIAALRLEAQGCEAANTARSEVMAEAQKHLGPAPSVLVQAATVVELEALTRVRSLWAAWTSGRKLDLAEALAAHMETHVLELDEAVAALVDEAAVELARREDVWRPFQLRLAEWLPGARTAVDGATRIPAIKKAEEWWKGAIQAVRDDRFRPIADRAMAVWKQLRLQSNVDLGAVELGGTGTSRRVTLKVTVDGKPAEALGVMSQGELHSLALSLFLPRATLAESPFRFVSVDDPVQSMDPARVEGLARALEDTAKTRQVIVFTHDDRLPDAVRRLGIPARVVGVTRRAESHVEVRAITDSVRGYLDDAFAVVKTDGLPPSVAARVAPGFCRSALEAACMDVIRRARLKKGHRHDDIEALLADNARLYPLMALTLCDDASKTGEVLSRLKGRFGPQAVDVFKACNAGAHESYEGDVLQLVRATETLTGQLLGGAS